MKRFPGRKGGVDSMAGPRDGKYLATAGSGSGGDRAVQVWDHAHHSVVATLEGHSADIQGEWFPGSSYAVLVQTEDGVLRLWDVPSGDLLTMQPAPRARRRPSR
jgi:WD40 repeat protein